MANHFDDQKPRLELLPADALTEWARAMTFGATKYGDHNWRKGLAWTRVLGSMARHMTAFMSGQDNDPESGVNHMAHVMCNAAFLLHYTNHKPDLDDRYKPPPECEVCGGDVDRLDPPAYVYRGPDDQFFYTFHSAEKELSDRPDHWTKLWAPHTPVYLFENVEELERVWDIYVSS